MHETPHHIPTNNTVLGIDPGSHKMGWGIVSHASGGLLRVAGGTIVPRAKDPLAIRLGFLVRELSVILDTHTVDVVAVESAFVHVNPRTAIVIGQARGIAIGLAAARQLPVHEYAPTKVKRHVVGSGRATKEQVRRMISIQLGLAELLPENEADALAVAITHVRSGGGVGDGGAEMTPARAYYAKVVAASRRRGGGGK